MKYSILLVGALVSFASYAGGGGAGGWERRIINCYGDSRADGFTLIKDYVYERLEHETYEIIHDGKVYQGYDCTGDASDTGMVNFTATCRQLNGHDGSGKYLIKVDISHNGTGSVSISSSSINFNFPIRFCR